MALGADLAWSIHAVLSRTEANGPGRRFGIWVQGCSLACPGCFNPETHASAPPSRTVADVLRELGDALPVDGVTISGGEPLDQPAPLAAFIASLRQTPHLSRLGVVVFSGYTRAEIESDPARLAAIGQADTVIAGRYNAALHLAQGLRGSSNKTYWHLTDRYNDDAFALTPDVEVLIGPDGQITVTGMQPLTATRAT